MFPTAVGAMVWRERNQRSCLSGARSLRRGVGGSVCTSAQSARRRRDRPCAATAPRACGASPRVAHSHESPQAHQAHPQRSRTAQAPQTQQTDQGHGRESADAKAQTREHESTKAAGASGVRMPLSSTAGARRERECAHQRGQLLLTLSHPLGHERLQRRVHEWQPRFVCSEPSGGCFARARRAVEEKRRRPGEGGGGFTLLASPSCDASQCVWESEW